ncbi:hypothetical protein [Evansella clarkii]|uniref:hypothetical protein n=1 Tax=Evansella clarkii TaxID=79879 RepID=UPI000B44B036|nr:hypothetical protein [Evansella clarkii]
MEFQEDKIVRLSIQFKSLEVSKAAAGVILKKRPSIGEKFTAFKVGSLYLTDVGSCYKIIFAILLDCLNEVPEDTELIIATCSHPNIIDRRVARKMNVFSQERGITYKTSFDTKPPRKVKDECYLLANDAIERGSTVFAEL